MAGFRPGWLLFGFAFMDRAVRIAVVGVVDERLLDELRDLPLRPEVRRFRSLFGDAEAIAKSHPDLLLAQLAGETAEDVGALRLLRQLWPNVAVLLVTTADREFSQAPLAARIGAALFVPNAKPGQLAAAIEQALHGGDRPPVETFLDLAHGIADEINNPLLFASGYLQLLRASLDPVAERDRRDQVDAALDGLDRISASVDRLRLVSEATNGPHRRGDVDLAALLTEAVQARPARAAATATLAIAPGPHAVLGDGAQLAAATAAVVGFADELAAIGAPTHVQLDPLPGARRLRLTADTSALRDWQLPLTFEPYYPNRALRGHGQGLSLFLAQTVVLGHKGQATARRLPDGALQIDFVLPA